MSDITESVEWKALAAHHAEVGNLHLRDLFDWDPARAERMSLQAGDLYLDYSKHRATQDTGRLLTALARKARLGERITAMFSGEHVNVTEDRAVLHTALRLPRGAALVVDGQDVVADVHAVLDRMGDFAERVRSGEWKGHTGKEIAAVVNIGIGGSDLGPAMAHTALHDYAQKGLTCRFVSNVDPADITTALEGLDPERTLFVISSKTFTTLETLTNAKVAKEWLLAGLGPAGGTEAEQAVARHFVAVSTNAERVAGFGIDPANMFGFWDWVGGRYSFDGAIGLSLMIAIGRDGFAELLAGFHTIDEHFRTEPFERNMPVLMALLCVWYTDFFGAQTHAVLPYSQRLARFPAYLQQLMMESNGKSARSGGEPVRADTGEIWWGEPGTNGQHAFYQLLHQGTRLVPADFIGFAEPFQDADGMHDLLSANLFAQTAVLAFGRSAREVEAEGVAQDLVPHKVMPGNRPSSTLLAPKLTPGVLGQLVALYEHIAFVQGVIWDIDSFDQWGVELGKKMANELTPALVDERPPGGETDASTLALVRWYRARRGRAV